jgi:hypothetical protein
MEQHQPLAVDETLDDTASSGSEQWLEFEREQLEAFAGIEKAACQELWTHRPIASGPPNLCHQKPPQLMIPQSPHSHHDSIFSKQVHGDGISSNAGCSSAYRCLFMSSERDTSLGSSLAGSTPCISDDTSSSRRQLQQWLITMEANLSSAGKKRVCSTGSNSNPCNPGVTEGPMSAGATAASAPIPPPAFALLGLLG